MDHQSEPSRQDRVKHEECNAWDSAHEDLDAAGTSGARPAEPQRPGDRRTDRRAAYTFSVQKACNQALLRVKQNVVLVNSNWAAPLAAAPSAISVMAILLKTAAEKNAAGLEIGDVVVKNEKGIEVGKLP